MQDQLPALGSPGCQPHTQPLCLRGDPGDWQGTTGLRGTSSPSPAALFRATPRPSRDPISSFFRVLHWTACRAAVGCLGQGRSGQPLHRGSPRCRCSPAIPRSRGGARRQPARLCPRSAPLCPAGPVPTPAGLPLSRGPGPGLPPALTRCARRGRSPRWFWLPSAAPARRCRSAGRTAAVNPGPHGARCAPWDQAFHPRRAGQGWAGHTRHVRNLLFGKILEKPQ